MITQSTEPIDPHPGRAPGPVSRPQRGPHPPSPNRPKILGQLLVEMNALGDDDLAAALEEQRETGLRIGVILIRHGAVDEESVTRALSVQLNLPYLAPPLEPAPDAVRAIQPRLARTRGVLPISLTPRAIRVAMSDPLDLAAIDDIQFQSGRRVEAAVAPPSAIADALARAYGGEVSDILDALPDRLTRVQEDDPRSLEQAASAAPVVRLVDHLLRTAVEGRASDIHVEHGDRQLRVRFRVDGVLKQAMELPAATRDTVLSRIKIMAGMDISVKRRPQDGGFSFRHGDSELNLRVSTLPLAEGEKAVIRILDPKNAPPNLEALGFSGDDLRRMRSLLRNGQGVILAAGPTGSGKSSTLFGALSELDATRQNIVTLEDPVEYRVAGVNQVQVQPRAGLTFPAALRSVLRQDPDVVMVGEIRDRETAEIAMAAAVTGHLVLSTIHTVDAPGGITRLLNMGVPPFLLAGGLAGIVAQRLVRKICDDCRGGSQGGNSRGRSGGRNGKPVAECPNCLDGYRGRMGVFQLLVMTDAMREEVTSGASLNALRRMAEEGGMGSMADDARRKVAEGLTTPHEVGRVLRADPGGARPCRKCGAGAPPGAPGCPHCGAPRIRLCGCGKELRSGWRFCAWCLRSASR